MTETTNETEKNLFAKKSRGEPTIFDEILSKTRPAEIIYEDDKCLAFNDINPQAPIHFLIIPKYRIPKLEDADHNDAEMLGHMMVLASKLGKAKSPDGFRLVVNNGTNSGQTVFHLHIHIIGGRKMKWPPG